MVQYIVTEYDKIIILQTAFNIFIIVYVGAADNYTSFNLINSFFCFTSNLADYNADYNRDKHIR